jgi:hypothetical protein
MAKFMLLLYNEPAAWQGLSPEETQATVEKYRAWRTKPYTTDSARLGDDLGKVLRSKNGKPVSSDGPYSETKEVLGGYYTIEAADYDEAVRLAQEHPHLEYGTIEIRRLWGQ